MALAAGSSGTVHATTTASKTRPLTRSAAATLAIWGAANRARQARGGKGSDATTRQLPRPAGITRRNMLQVGAVGALNLALPPLLRARGLVCRAGGQRE